MRSYLKTHGYVVWLSVSVAIFVTPSQTWHILVLYFGGLFAWYVGSLVVRDIDKRLDIEADVEAAAAVARAARIGDR